MNILYIACSCAPYSGSEDKIGWNVPMYSAKKHRVFVLTFERQREYIEAYLEENPTDNPTFYYVDIPEIWKKLFRGPFFSGRMNIWHRRAIRVVREICRREKIDIIHQITPVEFRSIGNYGRIPGVKFVCGPIAGGQSTLKELKEYTTHHRLVEQARGIVNAWSRVRLWTQRRLKQCDCLFIANYETERYLENMLPTMERVKILTDVSVDRSDLCEWDEWQQRVRGTTCRFLTVGRLVYLKGHRFLLDALAEIPRELEFVWYVVGEGPELAAVREKCKEMNMEDRVVFCGPIPHSEIAEVYRKADVFVMPSFREATGSVLLEAMAQGLPVITANRFGGAAILDTDIGWLYDGNSQEACVRSLRDALIACITQPEEVLRRGGNARMKAENYTWDKRMEVYQSVYEKVMRADRSA